MNQSNLTKVKWNVDFILSRCQKSLKSILLGNFLEYQFLIKVNEPLPLGA